MFRDQGFPRRNFIKFSGVLLALILSLAITEDRVFAESSPKKSTLQVRQFSDAEKRKSAWNNEQEAFFRKYLFIPTYDSWVEKDGNEVYKRVERFFQRSTEDGIFRPLIGSKDSEIDHDVKEVYKSFEPLGTFTSEAARKEAHIAAWNKFLDEMVEESAKPKSRDEQAEGAAEVFERETAKIKVPPLGTWTDDGVIVLPARDDFLPYMFGINEDRTIYLLAGDRREASEFRLKMNGFRRNIERIKAEVKKIGKPFFIQLRIQNKFEFGRNKAALMTFRAMMLDDDGIYRVVNGEIPRCVTDLDGKLLKDQNGNLIQIKGYEKAVFSNRNAIVAMTQLDQDVIQPQLDDMFICPNPGSCGGWGFAVPSGDKAELYVITNPYTGKPKYSILKPNTEAFKIWEKATEPAVRNLKNLKPYVPMLGEKSQVERPEAKAAPEKTKGQ